MYESIIKAIETKKETHPETFLQQLQINKSMCEDEIKGILSKYSNSAKALEDLLNSIKEAKFNSDSVEQLKKSHHSEISILKAEHSEEIKLLKALHSSETAELLERIRMLEKQRSNYPEV